jgi:peptidoglycan hydrolase-like protein with peptidoglycan-binding domain
MPGKQKEKEKNKKCMLALKNLRLKQWQIPADGVADLRPPVVPADGKKTKRRRVGSLARKARIQRRLNNRLGLTMNKIQAAVGAEETGKYDRETYREILDFQKANLPKTNKKGQKNWDGLVGPVTLAKLKSKFSDWASVGQARDERPSTPGISTKLDKTLKVGDKAITSKAEFQKLAQDLYKYRAELKDSRENNKPIQAVQGLRYNINDLADVDRQLKKKYGNRNIVKAYQDLFGFEI